MPKNPYIQLYIGDHLKDTRILPLNVQGGWMILLLYMWENDPKGELTGTMEDFTRLMSCSSEEAILVIQTLKEKKIFAWEEVGSGKLRIISRKQKKMTQLSEIRQKSGKNGGNPNLVKQPVSKSNNLVNQKDKLNTEYEYREEIGDKGRGVEKPEEEREDWSSMPGLANLKLILPEIKAGSARQLMRLNGIVATENQVLELWDVFKVQNFTGSKFYSTPDEAYSHFINWSKSQKINGKSHSNGADSKLGTSDARTQKAQQWGS